MINFQIRGLPQFQGGLQQFKRQYQGVATMAGAVYLVGNESHGLKHEPGYKYVSRKKAGLKTSAAQIRFMIATGILIPKPGGGFMLNPYKRTHDIRDSWRIVSSGLDARITNNAPGVGWAMGRRQARQLSMVGWRAYDVVYADNRAGISRASSQAVQKLMRDLLAFRGQ